MLLAIYNHEADNGLFHMGLKDPHDTIQKATFTCNPTWKNASCIEASFTHPDDLQIIVDAIEHAKPVEGILDMSTEYNAELVDNDQTTHHYSLSLGFEHNARTEGLLLEGADSHQGYRISSTDTNRLRDMILQSTTFPEGLLEPTVRISGTTIPLYSGAFCSSKWNPETHQLESICGIPPAPDTLDQEIEGQAISVTPSSQIKVDFPTKPAKIELYMVKNGERFPVEVDRSGRYTVPLERGYAKYVLSATWNKDNNIQYYFGVYIR